MRDENKTEFLESNDLKVKIRKSSPALCKAGLIKMKL